MVYLGCHLSSTKGFYAMGETAQQIGADTFQFFTRNPRGGKAKPMDEQDAAKLSQLQMQGILGPVIAHAPYTINPCSAEARTREFALQTMEDDLARLEHLPGNYYNFHPGSHVGQGTQIGIRLIAEALNTVLTQQGNTVVLLETMAGKGSEIGGSFEELREILDRVEHAHRMGVCLDTCHVHDGGYDIVHDLDGVLTEFDKVIGLDRLKALHINDSMNIRGARKDRHEKLGQGHIGLDAMVRIVTHPALQGRPMVLETPNELDGYEQEIRLLRERIGENV
ncbi:MAG: deoxyribonuclease IV [Oscillospiraceae bacterium]|nr:deoxyribonuclease IV [Oscillospiraceae bacterium]